ncbi:MAG: hypothetical protein ACLR37_02640 [Enterococcus avium]
MLTKRQKELLELLAQQSDFQTVEYFASKLGVSKRTTHSELRIIEDYLQSSGEYLEKKAWRWYRDKAFQRSRSDRGKKKKPVISIIPSIEESKS